MGLYEALDLYLGKSCYLYVHIYFFSIMIIADRWRWHYHPLKVEAMIASQQSLAADQIPLQFFQAAVRKIKPMNSIYLHQPNRQYYSSSRDNLKHVYHRVKTQALILSAFFFHFATSSRLNYQTDSSDSCNQEDKNYSTNVFLRFLSYLQLK